jgi:hypothetical protein
MINKRKIAIMKANSQLRLLLIKIARATMEAKNGK